MLLTFIYFASISIPLLLLNCQSVKPQQLSFPGMRQIAAKNHTITLGLASPIAGIEEKPPMAVGFTYNFWIDTTEITIEQYAALMGKLPAKINDTSGISNRPVSFISWCDAALFCNERSHRNGFDTIYSYLSREQDADGRTYRLNGLTVHLNKSGFRLPLEAEWEFAAYGGMYTTFPWGTTVDTAAAKQHAWFGLNSDGHLHSVAQLTPNGYGLYDMLGNALEWVHDYMGEYSNDTIINYSGPLFNTKDEHPVKGGSFKHTIEKLRPASRTDIYATLSSTATGYLGFRCCFGAVAHQKGEQTKTVSDSVNPVWLTNIDIGTLLPSRNAKLVFVNTTNGEKHLCYTDFNEPNNTVYTFTDFSPVYTPVISPDGRWVAFGTRGEGHRTGSDVYIRKLATDNSPPIKLPESPAFIPRWWTDPVNGDYYLVYTTTAVDNAAASWSSSSTRMQKVVNGQPSGTASTIDASGSFHDGLSFDKKYLATGFSLLRMKNLESGEVKTLFTSPQNGKGANDTSQVCNVSISPVGEQSDRLLFVDFGSGSKSSTITGTTYRSHEIIFMSDFSGTVLSWYRCPESELEWNHVEWSTLPQFAVATTIPKNSPETDKYIHLINLETKEVTTLAEGTDLRSPYLWISPVDTRLLSTINDSVGLYNDPPTRDAQYQFALKMPYFWKYSDSIEVLCLGSSRIQNGIAPHILAPYNTFNLGFATGGLDGIKDLLNDYAFYQCPNLKAVVISVDIPFFSDSVVDLAWQEIKHSKGYTYDRSNEFWKNGTPEGFIDAVLKADNPYIASIVENRGWVNQVSSGWGPSPPSYITDWIRDIDDRCLENVALLRSIAHDLQHRNIILVGIVFPMNPAFKETPVHGTYGLSQDAAKQLLSHILAIDAEYPLFHFYDIHNFGNHPFTDEDAVGDSHLSGTGAIKLSTWLKMELDTLLNAR